VRKENILRVTILIISALVVPFAWGWVSYSILEQIWPGNKIAPGDSPDLPPHDRDKDFLDYQI